MSDDQIKDHRSTSAPSPREPDTYDHAGIKALAKTLGLMMASLTVTQQDPFCADSTGGNSDSEGRIAGAHWFVEEVYERLNISSDAHMRRIHYKLVSQDPPVLMLNGDGRDMSEIGLMREIARRTVEYSPTTRGYN